jgi:hypothetical protein
MFIRRQDIFVPKDYNILIKKIKNLYCFEEYAKLGCAMWSNCGTGFGIFVFSRNNQSRQNHISQHNFYNSNFKF